MAGGTFSLANLFGITLRESLDDGSDFTNPDADHRRVFLGEDGQLHAKDSAGAVTDLTGAGAQDLAGKELDYVEITTPASITETTEAGADTVLTSSSVAYDGATDILIVVQAPYWAPDTVAAGRAIQGYLYEDSTSLGRVGLWFSQVAGVNAHQPLHIEFPHTPASASIVYTFRCAVTAGTGTVGAGAGGAGNDIQAFMRITRRTS